MVIAPAIRVIPKAKSTNRFAWALYFIAPAKAFKPKISSPSLITFLIGSKTFLLKLLLLFSKVFINFIAATYFPTIRLIRPIIPPPASIFPRNLLSSPNIFSNIEGSLLVSMRPFPP